MAKEDGFKAGAEAMLWHIVDMVKGDIETREYSLVSSAIKMADLADADKANEDRQNAKMYYERDKAAKSALEFLVQRLSSGTVAQNFFKEQEKPSK